MVNSVVSACEISTALSEHSSRAAMLWSENAQFLMETSSDLISISCSLTSPPIISGSAARKPAARQNDTKHLSSTVRNVRGQFDGNGVEGELKGAEPSDSYQFNFTFNDIMALKGLSILY